MIVSEDNYVHKITATGGSSASTVYDKWKFEVILVNYKDTDIDSQPGSADQSKMDAITGAKLGNAGRKFTATLHFEPLADQTQCTAEKYVAE